MNTGVSVNYKNLNNFDTDYSKGSMKITHVQITGIPADFATLKDELRQEIDNFRMTHPGIGVSFHAYTKMNFAEKVECVRRIWVRLANELVRFAGEVGAEFVNFHAGYGIDAGSRLRQQEYLEVVIVSLKEMVITAKSSGIEIHIENQYSESERSEFCCLGDRVSQLQKMFEQVDDNSLKLCYDYGHGNLSEHGIEILYKLAHHLGSIHAHDNDQMVDIHAPIGCPILGTIDWKRELKYLEEIDFNGPFILEGYLLDQLKSMAYLSRER